VQTGADVAWKVLIPAGGFNSPIVWKERVFLSGGDAKQREVFCFNSANGTLAWRRTADSGVAAAKAEVPESTGYAASTMATDGARVYVLFANGDVAALSLDGDVAWTKNLGPFKNAYGHAASLVTWQDHLLIQLDQGESTEGKSRLLALEGRTGKLIWERPRQVGASWSTPIVISAAGKIQVITLSVPWAAAYDVRNGTELWRVDGLGGEVTSSPVFENGLVIAVSPSEKLLAIPPDGQGDVTKTHIAWTNEENVPDITTPVCDGELLFTLTTGGTLTCHDLKDGKVQWQHDFDMDFHASPAIAGKRMYLFSQKGTAIVLGVGPQFEELFRAEMGEEVHSSPAFAGDKIFLRGAHHLWCLARGAQTLARQQ
jgi:outer membrane protein assembly factor BamB